MIEEIEGRRGHNLQHGLPSGYAEFPQKVISSHHVSAEADVGSYLYAYKMLSGRSLKTTRSDESIIDRKISDVRQGFGLIRKSMYLIIIAPVILVVIANIMTDDQGGTFWFNASIFVIILSGIVLSILIIVSTSIYTLIQKIKGRSDSSAVFDIVADGNEDYQIDSLSPGDRGEVIKDWVEMNTSDGTMDSLMKSPEFMSIVLANSAVEDIASNGMSSVDAMKMQDEVNTIAKFCIYARCASARNPDLLSEDDISVINGLAMKGIRMAEGMKSGAPARRSVDA